MWLSALFYGISVSPAPSSPECVPIRDPMLITCPVMSSLVKNGDLIPDCDGLISKTMAIQSMLRVGISGRTTMITANANFNHLPGADDEKMIDLWAMNTIKRVYEGGSSDGQGGIEHFRSTGIRDSDDGPKAELYELFESKMRGDSYDLFDVTQATAVFDVEKPYPNVFGDDVHSNDVNIDFPQRETCPPNASLTTIDPVTGAPMSSDACFSNLHGSISLMFQEYGTPSGPRARLSAMEMRALWLDGNYPAGFVERSPRSCVGGEFGCDSCFNAYNRSSANRHLKMKYCRCMTAVDFKLSGGFNSTSAIVLPGALASLSNTYNGTCTTEEDTGGRPGHGDFDRRPPHKDRHNSSGQKEDSDGRREDSGGRHENGQREPSESGREIDRREDSNDRPNDGQREDSSGRRP